MFQKRKPKQKLPPLRPSASTKTPGQPVFERPAAAAAASSRQRASTEQRPSGRSRGGGSSTLAEGLLFSHRPNPIFDTSNTSSSSRGDDYEVIDLTQRPSNGSTITGIQDVRTVSNSEILFLCRPLMILPLARLKSPFYSSAYSTLNMCHVIPVSIMP